MKVFSYSAVNIDTAMTVCNTSMDWSNQNDVNE